MNDAQTCAITGGAFYNPQVPQFPVAVIVTFDFRGALQCSDTTAPYSCGWRVPNPMNRNYQIQARAFDAAGNNATRRFKCALTDPDLL